MPTPHRPQPARVRRTAWVLASATTLSALSTITGIVAASPTSAAPAAVAPGPVSDRAAAIAAAARAYGVPVSLLSAYSYAQTRWDDHGGHPSAEGGYGPGHLVDASALETGGRDGGGPGDTSGQAAKARLDTLGRAARLTGYSRERLETDPAANLRGAAALLADEQRSLGRATGTSTDPGSWYGAVVATAPTDAAGLALADAVVSTLRTGATRTTSDGRRVTLARTAVGRAATAQRAKIRATARRGGLLPVPTEPVQGLDCPTTLDCEWLPAPYAQLSADPTDYGNHDLAQRPVSPTITTIVIHDTETPYGPSVNAVQDPTYLGWQYTIRSTDGHVAQHLDAKDIGWQAGNWYVNMHSIGVEHEGYAAKGATWFSEPMYRASATLVHYLATRYHIPLDRGHIIGHDQVPGTTPATIKGMHWDPGPYWDWQHYFDLLGAPLDAGTRNPKAASNRPSVGQAVRVLPTFATNVQPITGCTTAGALCAPQGSNIVPVHAAPDATSPLVNDIGLRPDGSPSTWTVSDWGGKAAAGTDYVVGAVSGDWVGIWFAGRLGWVLDPAADPTLRVLKQATVAQAVGTSAPTYGRAYPEASAYPAGETPQDVVPLPYTIAQGQSYVVLDENPPVDYYKAKTYSPTTPGDHVDFVGQDRYVLVSLGHRVGYVRRADITLRAAR